MDSQNVKDTPKGQVHEIIKLLKEGKLSVEELAKLIPITQEFMSSLSEVMKEMLKEEKEEHAENIQALKKLIEALTISLSQSNLSAEEKKAVFELLNNIQKSLHDIEIFRIKNKHSTIKYIATLMAGIIALLAILLGNKKNPAN